MGSGRTQGFSPPPAVAPVAFTGNYADLTGKPSLGTIASFNAGDYATPAQVDARIQQVVGMAPAALDTLQEIATQLQQDESAATALTATVAGKFTQPSGTVGQYIRGDGSLASFPAIPAAQVQSNWTQADSAAPDYIRNKPALFPGAYADLTGKPSLFSGAYSDLTGKPTIPAAQIQSDWAQANSAALDFIKNKPVLFSGSYTDLTNKPAIPAAQVNSDWSAVSGVAQILNKPTLFSGAYADLTGKPTIPAAQVNSDWNAVSGVSQILNKPTIPAAQIQSDWNQASTGALDYIKNKPSIPGASTVAVNAPLTNAGTSTAANLSISPASALAAGSMSAADFLKLSKATTMAFVATTTKTVGVTGVIGLAGTETSMIPTGNGSLLIPAAIFDAPGYTFLFRASGVYTNTVGLITIKVKLGTLITLQLTSLNLPSVTGRNWVAEGTGSVRAGRVLSSHAVFNFDDGTTKVDGAMFAGSTVTVTAGDKTADMTAQWNLNIAAASITVEEMWLSVTPSP